MYIECKSGRRPLNVQTVTELARRPDDLLPIPVPPRLEQPSLWRRCLGRLAAGRWRQLRQNAVDRTAALDRTRQLLVGLRTLLQQEWGHDPLRLAREPAVLALRAAEASPRLLAHGELVALVQGCARLLVDDVPVRIHSRTPSPAKTGSPLRAGDARAGRPDTPLLPLRRGGTPIEAPLRYDVLKDLGRTGAGGASLDLDRLPARVGPPGSPARPVSVAAAAARPVGEEDCADAPALLAAMRDLLESEYGGDAVAVATSTGQRELASFLAHPGDGRRTVGQLAFLLEAAGRALIAYEARSAATLNALTRASARADQPMAPDQLPLFAYAVARDRMDTALGTVGKPQSLPAGVVWTLNGWEPDFDPQARGTINQMAREAVRRASDAWGRQLTPRQAAHAIEMALCDRPLFGALERTQIPRPSVQAVERQLQRQARSRAVGMLRALRAPLATRDEVIRIVRAAREAVEARAGELRAGLVPDPAARTDLVQAAGAIDRVVAAVVHRELRTQLLAWGQARLAEHLRTSFPGGIRTDIPQGVLRERIEALQQPTQDQVARLVGQVAWSLRWAERGPRAVAPIHGARA